MTREVDDLYDAGQAHQNRGEHGLALRCFGQAYRLAPDDLVAGVKVVQALHALDRHAEAADVVCEILGHAQVGALGFLVIDQKRVGDLRLLVHRNLEPTHGEGVWSPYQAFVLDPDDRVLGTAQLETSAPLRDSGVPYAVGVTDGDGHRLVGPTFLELPSYEELLPIFEELLLAPPAATPSNPMTHYAD